MIGCPYPFSYIHIIYWVVQVSLYALAVDIASGYLTMAQIYLFILAVETGVQLAIYTKRLGNGAQDRFFSWSGLIDNDL
jgi:hypothetical protein